MSCPTLAGDSNVARAGAARRRRERRLRSMLRHERQTVAMELAAALRHSRDARSEVAHEALRGQKTASSGSRPAPLAEIAEPQGLSVAPRCPDAGVPLLSVPLLAGGDGLDNTSVRWLLKAALKKKEEEEEERKVQERKERVMQDIHRKIHANEDVSEAEWAAWRTWHGLGSSSSGGQKRKRKKRRKRKLPRNSSCPRLAARHLGRYGPEGHSCRDTVTAFVARAVRTWKPGLSTSHWYLAATCPVLVLPEECCGCLASVSRGQVQICRKLRILRSCSSSLVIDIFFVPQWQFLMVQTIQQTTEIHQLLFDGRCPRYAGVQSLRCCRGEDFGAPTVAARTLSTTLCSVFARGVQDSGLFWENTPRYAVFCASWFNSGYMSTSVYVVVFLAGCDAPRAVFPCLSAFRRRQQWLCTAGFTVDEANCAVFSFPVVRPKMRDIMAGMDEKDGEFPCCSSTRSLYLAVTCTVLVLPAVYWFMDCSGR